MDINQNELAELVQKLITDALVKGGIILPQAPVVEEVPATPEYLVTIDEKEFKDRVLHFRKHNKAINGN